MFGETIQCYSTPACNMKCVHCSSRLQGMKEMSMKTLQDIINFCKMQGILRIELFANNPQLHKEFDAQIDMLNDSGLDYAILAVGADPDDPKILDDFKESILKMNDHGGLVFSVDYTKEIAEQLLKSNHKDTHSYAHKALSFWNLIPFLKEHNFKVRTNSVISKHTIKEIPEIIKRVAQEGFGASFCFVQCEDTYMKRIKKVGFQYSDRIDFKTFLERNQLPDFSVDRLSSAFDIFVRGKAWQREDFQESFNRFRGLDKSEGDLNASELNPLKDELLDLKRQFPDNVLPDSEFIKDLGFRGNGCVDLLRIKKFPQLKIGSEGQFFFCCDMHDPVTRAWNIHNFNEKEMLDSISLNPYIWLCACFNPCAFSVNKVKYKTIVKI